MEEVFILDDNANLFYSRVIHEIGVIPIEYIDLRTDKEIDNYVTNIFSRKNNIKKLIIPVSLGEGMDNHIGLRIALHIRLSSKIGDYYLIPIILISDSSLETLLINQDNKYALIAATEGCALVQMNLNEIRAYITYGVGAPEIDFKAKVLENLIIKGPDTMGPHSMANEWGVVQLDKIANLSSLGSFATAAERKVSLYFKYLLSLNKNRSVVPEQPLSTNVSTPNIIHATGKKILYIDDEGQKGWTLALTRIFSGAIVTSITGDNQSETNFMSLIRSEIHSDWDLILLDLRLLPWKEDIAGEVLQINSYSGTQILKEIKAINDGTQVIIFTASNKAWNMRDLVNLGADGYYIKESPKYLIPDHLSLQNYESFKSQVLKCFQKEYLRVFYKLKEEVKSENVNIDIGFMAYSENSLNEFFKLLKLNMFESAFINLFLPIEQYTDTIVTGVYGEVVDLNGNPIPMKAGNTYKMVYDKTNLNFQVQTSTKKVQAKKGLGKISFAMAFKYSKDNIYLMRIGELVKKRNEISHGSNTNITLDDFRDLIGILKIFRSNL